MASRGLPRRFAGAVRCACLMAGVLVSPWAADLASAQQGKKPPAKPPAAPAAPAVPVGAAPAAAAAAPSPAQQAADKAIRETAQAFVTAFNAGDAKAVAGLWTPDGTLVDEQGQTFKGRQAIENEYAALFAAFPDAKLEVAIQSIELVAPQMAIEDGIASVVGGADVRPSASRYTAVHVFDGKAWQMAAVRESHFELNTADVGVGDLEWLLGTWEVKGKTTTVELTFAWAVNKAFIEGTHIVKEGDKITFEGKQIIGWDPRQQAIAVWVFNSDGSLAYGPWTPHPTGWTISLSGVTADGIETHAVNSFSRADDALVWKSVDRTAGGMPLPDTTEAVLKRKK